MGRRGANLVVSFVRLTTIAAVGAARRGSGGGPDAVGTRRRWPLDVVEYALHRAARVGLDGTRPMRLAHSAAKASQGSKVGWAQAACASFEEPVVVELPRARAATFAKTRSASAVASRAGRSGDPTPASPTAAVDAALDVARLAAEVA